MQIYPGWKKCPADLACHQRILFYSVNSVYRITPNHSNHSNHFFVCIKCIHWLCWSCNINLHPVSGSIHVREIYFFFNGRELSGNSVMCQGKMKFCKNAREFYILTWWSWNVYPDVSFFANFIEIFGSSTVRENWICIRELSGNFGQS